MIKRAAIIITDQSSIKWRGWNDPVFQTQGVEASDELLEDLTMLAYLAADDGDLSDVTEEDWREIASRVRDWLPKEKE